MRYGITNINIIIPIRNEVTTINQFLSLISIISSQITGVLVKFNNKKRKDKEQYKYVGVEFTKKEILRIYYLYLYPTKGFILRDFISKFS